MQIGFNATKVFSSIRVTNTVVVDPFLGKVAVVVEPIDRSPTVRFFPATVNAFASAGGVSAEGDGIGVAAGVGVTLGEGDALGVEVGEDEGEGAGLAVGFATGLGGAFLTGFFTTFFAGGFFAANARSPKNVAETIAPIIVRTFRRPDQWEFGNSFSMVIQSILFDCSARKYGCNVNFLRPRHRQRKEVLIHYMPIQHSYRNL